MRDVEASVGFSWTLGDPLISRFSLLPLLCLPLLSFPILPPLLPPLIHPSSPRPSASLSGEKGSTAHTAHGIAHKSSQTNR